MSALSLLAFPFLPPTTRGPQTARLGIGICVRVDGVAELRGWCLGRESGELLLLPLDELGQQLCSRRSTTLELLPGWAARGRESVEFVEIERGRGRRTPSPPCIFSPLFSGEVSEIAAGECYRRVSPVRCLRRTRTRRHGWQDVQIRFARCCEGMLVPFREAGTIACLLRFASTPRRYTDTCLNAV